MSHTTATLLYTIAPVLVGSRIGFALVRARTPSEAAYWLAALVVCCAAVPIALALS